MAKGCLADALAAPVLTCVSSEMTARVHPVRRLGRCSLFITPFAIYLRWCQQIRVTDGALSRGASRAACQSQLPVAIKGRHRFKILVLPKSPTPPRPTRPAELRPQQGRVGAWSDLVRDRGGARGRPGRVCPPAARRLARRLDADVT